MAPEQFPETQWSLVLEAASGNYPERARSALHRLCEMYVGTVYRWMRVKGLRDADAEDATQDFITHWLTKENPLADFEYRGTKFRNFLSIVLGRFLLTAIARREALKRGGGAVHVPLLDCDVTCRDETPGASLDAIFARDVHEMAVRALKANWQEILPDGGLDRLLPGVLGEADLPKYHVLARELGSKTGTVKSWVFRMRREYYNAFRDRVRPQCAPADLDGEVVHLLALLQTHSPLDEAFSVRGSQPGRPVSRLCA